MLPGPSGRVSERVSRGLRAWGAPESPKSAPGVRKESKKSQKLAFLDSFRTSGCHSLGILGLPRAGGRGTPFRTLFGLFWGSGREGPGALCARPGGSLRHVFIPVGMVLQSVPIKKRQAVKRVKGTIYQGWERPHIVAGHYRCLQTKLPESAV